MTAGREPNRAQRDALSRGPPWGLLHPALNPRLSVPLPEPRAKRCRVVANDPAALIPDGPASRELGRDRRGREVTPVGESLAVAQATGPSYQPEPGKPLLRRFWEFWGRLRGIRSGRIACNARTRPQEG